jgi:hypothetical protein
MLQTAALLIVLIAMSGAAVAEDAKPDTIQVQGKSLALSCTEWKRNPDGSWTNIGPILVGDRAVNEVTLRGKEAKVLEDKCGNAAPASVPPQSGESPRHVGHRHGVQQPPGGT